MRKPSKGSAGTDPGGRLVKRPTSESCVDSERSELRSVDSEYGGPCNSAPKDRDEEADAVFRAEGNTDGIEDHDAGGSSGVREPGTSTRVL
jgi:hypothetical protein